MHSKLLKEAEKLRRTKKRIKCMLEDAEQRRSIEDQAVKHWITELKHSAMDADDVLDLYNTLQYKLSNKDKVNPIDFEAGRSLTDQSDSFITEIEAINGRLEEISKARENFRLDSNDGEKRKKSHKQSNSPANVSAYIEANVVGREYEKKKIIEELTPEKPQSIAVIPIRGVAGIGKTTLAQMVYNDDNVKNYFDLKVWVSVPDRCDVVWITTEILETIKRKKVDSLSFDMLQRQLSNELDGKRFLLLIDNLWAEDNVFWETLLGPLVVGLKGSKVLITTRSEVVYKGKGVLYSEFSLGGLGENECWELLRDGAFPQGGWEGYPELESVGREIIKKCQGSPLAAKSIGDVLRNEPDESEWVSLRDEMWAMRDDGNVMLSALMISYKHLNYHLKQCFAYCSVFPIGYEFEKDEVVKMWIAEGLVQSIGTRRLEAIGGEYFNNLQWRSFFETSRKENRKYKMPSLIHELARLVSKSETLIFRNNEVKDEFEDPKQARYASLVHEHQKPLAFGKLCKYTSLRAVSVFGESTVHMPIFPEDFICKLKYLRTLNLGHTDIEELPDSIGNLILLRYLGLNNTRITVLPETISYLHNLQTINLRECYFLLKLPSGIRNLLHLRHIDLRLQWEKITDMESMPPGISSLTSVETLSRFSVTKTFESGCNIGELKDLKLRGELCISKLENVTDARHAVEVNLEGKAKYIEKLMLRWSEDAQWMSYTEEVARLLHPSERLKVLWIGNYPGKRFPSWLGDKSFSNLERLTLSGSRECVIFPQLDELPKLKNLLVEHMLRVTCMGKVTALPALEILTVREMPSLETWFEVEAGLIPNLQKLFLYNCPRLRELKHLPSEIKQEIFDCDNLSKTPIPDYMATENGI